MFTITKEFKFEAAHRLPKHNGKCARLHGHSWVMRVVLASPGLIEEGSKTGMVEDFGTISQEVAPLLEGALDHYYLNETTHLENPTSEELARWIYNQLKPHMPDLVAVEVDETCTSSCRYCPSYPPIAQPNE